MHNQLETVKAFKSEVEAHVARSKLAAAGITVNILNIGIPDRYIDHGSRGDCLAMAGLDTDGILEQVNNRLKAINTTRSASGSDI